MSQQMVDTLTNQAVTTYNKLRNGDAGGDRQVCAILTVGVLLASQLNNVASSIDTKEIAEAITNAQK